MFGIECHLLHSRARSLLWYLSMLSLARWLGSGNAHNRKTDRICPSIRRVFSKLVPIARTPSSWSDLKFCQTLPCCLQSGFRLRPGCGSDGKRSRFFFIWAHGWIRISLYCQPGLLRNHVKGRRIFQVYYFRSCVWGQAGRETWWFPESWWCFRLGPRPTPSK